MPEKPRIIIIVGPTGVGKTELAIRLALDYGGEIISADSMQVYRHMDIGTAKPTREQMSAVRHHLIDVVDPDEDFNAAVFVDLADRAVRELEKEDRNIFLVGGTGLYIRALTGGLFEGPGADSELRGQYREELRLFGKEYLYRKLKEKDPQAASRIKPNDTVRMIRALEVYTLCGQSIVKKQNDHGFRKRPYECLKIGLIKERGRLYRDIDCRCEDMIRKGLVEEVETLLKLGFGETLKPMCTFNYRYIVDYLKGKYPLAEALRWMKRDTRRYAKRQMTWFRRDEEIEWYVPSDITGIKARIEKFLKGVSGAGQAYAGN
ncbi:MAG: tRNA (adenosine(37)-N6)-dimethylallyltransferase MiaA [Syntrophales bacterium]